MFSIGWFSLPLVIFDVRWIYPTEMIDPVMLVVVLCVNCRLLWTRCSASSFLSLLLPLSFFFISLTRKTHSALMTRIKNTHWWNVDYFRLLFSTSFNCQSNVSLSFSNHSNLNRLFPLMTNEQIIGFLSHSPKQRTINSIRLPSSRTIHCLWPWWWWRTINK